MEILQSLSLLLKWLPTKVRRKLVGLIILMIMASFAEMLSLGAAFPFLAAIMNPSYIYNSNLIGPILNWLGVEEQFLVFYMAAIFCLAISLATILKITLILLNNKVAFSIGSKISSKIYESFLNQPYLNHVSKNSSESISLILNRVDDVTYGILSPALTVLSTFLILTFMFVGLLFINSTLTLGVFFFFFSVYLIMTVSTNSLKRKNSQKNSTLSSHVIKLIQESFGGIKEIILDASQSVYVRQHKTLDSELRKAQASTQAISHIPKYVVEAIALFFIIAVVLYFSGDQRELAIVIPMLGVMALAGQRVLPLMQQIYSALTAIQSYRFSLYQIIDALPDLDEQKDSDIAEPLRFEREIILQNVSFSYDASKKNLDSLSIVIKKGERVGIFGASGSGKTTFVDLLMGLIHPQSGEFLVDGRPLNKKTINSWRKKIAHVPQSIYLLDGTIAENIAFGVEDIDVDQLSKAISKANLDSVVSDLPQGFNTFVGERGVRLSGGQRQRIGIARAFYKSAEIIIFDEATSALDSEAETIVMQAVDGLSPDITSILIAHRTSTLKNCTKIIEILNGKITRVGAYDDFFNN